MIDLATSRMCASGVHCVTCRDPRKRSWRQSLAKVFLLPAGAPDFSCPHGQPWISASTSNRAAALLPPFCPTAATWCPRFRQPTGPAACACCTAARTLDPADPDLCWWFIQAMADIARANRSLACPHHQNSGRTEPTLCCGGQVKDLPVYLCALTGERAACARCRTRFAPINPQDNPTLPPTT